MQPDPHAKGGVYTIRSLYFDTPSDRALREKLDGVSRREKFRIRYYNGDSSVIHLEKKIKFGGLGNKQSAELSVVLMAVFMGGEALGIQPAGSYIGYEDRLFDSSRVHTIDIVTDDWDGFIETCQNEEYSACSVVIDGESYKNVGIRGKGNTSLSSVAAMGSNRYSFKIEFDKYDGTKSYHGLDKLSLNNLIQDNTMMKDYLTYRMMGEFGVAAPLCSFVYITVNGEDRGLYLAVEGVEEAFLRRNYGSDYGELYKPDSMSFGGGRGNGRDFDFGGFGGGFGGSSDVKLQYIDDDPSSYANIFDNAKTDVSDADRSRLIGSLKSLSEYADLESVLDLDAVLRYFVVHGFVVNGDSYTGSMIHNYYLYEEDGRLSMIPWDYNLAFGTFSGGAADSAVNDAIDDALSDRPMQAWIFTSEEYTARYHELYAEFLDSVDAERIIDDACALIADYVERDPTRFRTYDEFETGVRALKSFCELRQASVRGQLDGSIPSTSAGQSDSAALVNADGLNLSDMGTMNGGGGFAASGGTIRRRLLSARRRANEQRAGRAVGGGRLDIPAYPARSVGADTSCRVVDRVQIQEVVICTKRPWNLKFRGPFCLRMFPKRETVTEKF